MNKLERTIYVLSASIHCEKTNKDCFECKFQDCYSGSEKKRAIDDAILALRKQVATEPIYDPPTGVADAIYCPNCKYDLMGGIDSYTEHDPPYCWECGQALLWESKELRMTEDTIRPPASQKRTAQKRTQKESKLIIFRDGECPECGRFCGNGGCGPLRCQCGWAGNDEESDELEKAIEALFADDEFWRNR